MIKSLFSRVSRLFGLCLLISIARLQAEGGTEHVLYAFLGNGIDGANPSAGVISDPSGNLYGTTVSGGIGSVNNGTVFKLAPPINPAGKWTETVLYSFQGGADGVNPSTNLVFDASGNLYGSTLQGGASTTCNNCGVIFELSPPSGSGPWTESILYTFQGGPDGHFPSSGLIFDRFGRLYGTTSEGGGTGCGGLGCGTVFQLSPPVRPSAPWTETVLWAFGGNEDGSDPAGNLAIDLNGNLYGITSDGGSCSSCGTVFKLSPPVVTGPWVKHVLHYFGDHSGDGVLPVSGPTIHEGVFGTTWMGGQLGVGTAYKIDGGGGLVESVIYSFGSSSADTNPSGGLAFDHAGNAYGTNSGGSSFTGTVFQLQPQNNGDWIENILYVFGDANDGGAPRGALLLGARGIYGTTSFGGNSTCSDFLGGCGVVFAITDY
jgi:uncharacterized repeat protein (TIGR03803 family)